MFSQNTKRQQPPVTPSIDNLPDSAFLREKDLVRRPGNKDSILPFSPTTLRRLVASGNFPPPKKLAPRCQAWSARDVRNWLAEQVG